MKKERKLLVLFCILSLSIFLASTISIHANSAQTYFEGIDANGLVLTDTESPVVVESEKLIFDIPKLNFDHTDVYNEHGCVTAEYSFYNPSSSKITSKLLFPIGRTDLLELGSCMYDKVEFNKHLEKYDILSNGVVVNKRPRFLRFFPKESGTGKYDVAKVFPTYSDKYIEDDLYQPTTDVYRYTVTIDEIIFGGDIKYPLNIGLDIEIPRGKLERSVYLPRCNTVFKYNDKYRIGGFGVSKNNSFHFYVFGKDLTEEPIINVYDNRNLNDDSAYISKFSYVKDKTTLEDYILSNYSDDFAISKVDYYNLRLYEMMQQEDSPYLNLDRYKYNSILCFEYELTFEPNSRITNKVKVPLYGAMHRDYQPNIYEFTYYLSPAKSWKDFGNLDIIIKTPYYLIESEGFEFIKQDGYYELNLENLPKGDLEFSLSSSEHPHKRNSSFGCNKR